MGYSKGLLQEKFQISAPRRPHPDNEWVMPDTQSHRSDMKWRTYDNKNHDESVMGKTPLPITESVSVPITNDMPPGMFIDNQSPSTTDGFGYRFGDGPTGPEQVITQEDIRNGYRMETMSPIEDMYTNEHTEAFYGDAGGFVERNNYLDRT